MKKERIPRIFAGVAMVSALAATASAQSVGSLGPLGATNPLPAERDPLTTLDISPSSPFAVGAQLSWTLTGSSTPSEALIGSGLVRYTLTKHINWNTHIFANVSNITPMLMKGPDSVRVALRKLTSTPRGLDLRVYEEHASTLVPAGTWQQVFWASGGLRVNSAKAGADSSVVDASQVRGTIGGELRWYFAKKVYVKQPLTMSAEVVEGYLYSDHALSVIKAPGRNMTTVELTVVVPSVVIKAARTSAFQNYALLAQGVLGVSSGMPNQMRVGILATKSADK